MRYRLLFLLIVLVLAACGGEADSTQEAAPADAQQAQEDTLPNLVISSVEGDLEVVIPAGHNSVTAEFGMVITNQGQQVYADFSNMVFLSDDRQFDGGAVDGLDAEQSIFMTVKVSFDVAGEYILQFVIDSDSVITESDEDDNSFSLDVSVEKE